MLSASVDLVSGQETEMLSVREKMYHGGEPDTEKSVKERPCGEVWISAIE